jgi:hypothetical protein
MTTFSGAMFTSQCGEETTLCMYGTDFFTSSGLGYIPKPHFDALGGHDAWLDSVSDAASGSMAAHSAPTMRSRGSGLGAQSCQRNFFYDKIYIRSATNELAAIVSDRAISVSVWNANFTSASATAFTAEGQTVGVTAIVPRAVSYSFAALEFLTYTFDFAKDGPATADVTYTLTIDGVAYSIDFTGMRAVPWKWWPQTGLKETLETTDWIFTAYDGTEQRAKLRDAPKRSYSMKSLMTPAEWRTAHNTLYGKFGQSWIVPLFHQAEFKSGTIASADTAIAADTTAADYRVGDYVLVWQSADLCAFGEIESMTSSVITLTDGIGIDVSGSYRVAPAYIACIGSQLKADKDPSGYVMSSVDCVMFDAPALSYTPAETFLGLDVFPFIPEGKDHEQGFRIETLIIDDGIGRGSWLPKWNRPKDNHSVKITLLSSAELQTAKAFYHAHQKVIPFWCQSRIEDLVSVAAISSGSGTITIEPDGFLDVTFGRDALRIDYADGSHQYVSVTSSAQAGDHVNVNISPSTNNASTMAATLSFLTKCRFGGNASFTHHGHESEMTAVVVQI